MTETGKRADVSPGEAAIIIEIRKSTRAIVENADRNTRTLFEVLQEMKGALLAIADRLGKMDGRLGSIEAQIARGNRERREDSRLVLAEIAEGNRKPTHGRGRGGRAPKAAPVAAASIRTAEPGDF